MATHGTGFWIKCETSAEAERVAHAVADLRASLHGPENLSDAEQKPHTKGAQVKISLADYLPDPLAELKDDAAASETDVIRVSERLVILIERFERAFGQTQVVNISPLIDPIKVDVPGVSVQATPIDWPQTRDRLRNEHKNLLAFVKAVQKSLQRGRIETLNITRAAGGISVLRNGVDAGMTMAHDRTLAALFLLGLNDVSVEKFCDLYSKEQVVEHDSTFDTAVRSLKKEIPTLTWKAEKRGTRNVRGIVVNSALTQEELKDFLRATSGHRKPRRTSTGKA